MIWPPIFIRSVGIITFSCSKYLLLTWVFMCFVKKAKRNGLLFYKTWSCSCGGQLKSVLSCCQNAFLTKLNVELYQSTWSKIDIILFPFELWKASSLGVCSDGLQIHLFSLCNLYWNYVGAFTKRIVDHTEFYFKLQKCGKVLFSFYAVSDIYSFISLKLFRNGKTIWLMQTQFLFIAQRPRPDF